MSFETYGLQFEAACKATKWRDDEKAMALAVVLQGLALDLLRTLLVTEKAIITSFMQHWPYISEKARAVIWGQCKVRVAQIEEEEEEED